MVFYFLITAVTIALAGLMDAVWTRSGQEAGGVVRCAGQAAESAASGNGRRARGIPSSGGGLFPAGVSRRRAFDIVCLAAIFLILAGVSALRLEVGNDYGKYVENFHEIWAGTDQAYVVTEAGFNFVVWLIYTISGYENYLLVFAVFGAVTAFLFLKALYEQSECFWQSFAMFMLLGVYFRTFTTVRYYLALAAALYGIRFVLRRQYGCFVIWIGIAALFHKSVGASVVFVGCASVEKMDRAGADCDRRDRFCFPASAFKSGADVVSYIQGHRISVTGYRSESECVRNPPVRARFYAGGSGW